MEDLILSQMCYRERKYLHIGGKPTLDHKFTFLSILHRHKKSLFRAQGSHSLFFQVPNAFPHSSFNIYNYVMGMDETLPEWNESLHHCNLRSLSWENSPIISEEFSSICAINSQIHMDLSFQEILALIPFSVLAAVSQ